MSPPIRIEKIELKGFRAYLQPQTIKLYRKNTPLSLAIFAPNAKGKSSLVDGFEFYFSEDGTLKRLGNREANRYAGPRAMEHVAAKDSGITPSVHLWFRDGQDKFDDLRLITSENRILPTAAKWVLNSTVLPFIIRGYELRDFVEGKTPEDRYKEIAAWLTLDPILKIQQNLRSLRRQLKRRVESNSERSERLRDLSRITGEHVTTWNEIEVCTWFNSHILTHLDETLTITKLADTDITYRELLRRKAAEDEQLGLATLGRLVTFIEALLKMPAEKGEGPTGKIKTFQNAVTAYKIAITEEANEQSKASQAIFSEIWAAAKTIFGNEEVSLDKCPVCDTDLTSTPHNSRTEVAINLETKLNNLADYQAAERELKKAKKALDEALHALKNALETLTSSLQDIRYEDKMEQITVYHQVVKNWKPGESTPDNADILAELKSLHGSISAEKERIENQQGEHTYAKAIDILDQLLQSKVNLERIEQTKDKLEELLQQLNQQDRVINANIVAHTRGLIDKLQDNINELYKEIQCSNESAPLIRFELPDDEKTNQQRIELLIDFAENRRGVVPSGYLSDSQIHTLALSLRLAAIRLFNTQIPIIILDDVVTSYDADHRKNIASMLVKHFSDFQIMLVTHDEQFFNILQDHFSNAHWEFQRILKIEANFGPKFHKYRTSDEVIQEKLEAGKSAANEIRQAEEEWLLDICRGFRVLIAIRPVDRVFTYERSELAQALARFLKDAGLLPPEVSGISNPFLNSIQRGTVENFGNHFSDNPNQIGSVGDETRRWQEFKFFRDQFVCKKCRKNRFKRLGNSKIPVCVSCETPFCFPEL